MYRQIRLAFSCIAADLVAKSFWLMHLSDGFFTIRPARFAEQQRLVLLTLTG